MYLFREDFWVPTMCVLCLMPHVRARASGLHKAFTECAPPCRSFERERVTDGARDERERCGVRGSIVRKREAITTTQNRGANTPLSAEGASRPSICVGHVHHAQTPSRRGRRPSIRPPPSTCGKFYRRRDHRTGSGMGGGPRTTCRAPCGVRQRGGANTAAATRAAACAVRRAAATTSTAR